MAKATKKQKVIALKTITIEDKNSPTGTKTYKASEKFEGIELTFAEFKIFDKINAVKAYIDESDFEEDSE